MKKIIIIVATICLSLVLVAYLWAETDWVDGEVIVQLKTNISSLPQKGSSTGIVSLDLLGLNLGIIDYEKLIPKESVCLPNVSQMLLLKFPESSDVQEICRQYILDSNVLYAEPNYIGKLHGIPDDTYWYLQWGPFNDRLNLSSAWDIATGSPDVVVAVIHNRIDTLHPDLRQNLWLNGDEYRTMDLMTIVMVILMIFVGGIYTKTTMCFITLLMLNMALHVPALLVLLRIILSVLQV